MQTRRRATTSLRHRKIYRSTKQRQNLRLASSPIYRFGHHDQPQAEESEKEDSDEQEESNFGCRKLTQDYDSAGGGGGGGGGGAFERHRDPLCENKVDINLVCNLASKIVLAVCNDENELLVLRYALAPDGECASESASAEVDRFVKAMTFSTRDSRNVRPLVLPGHQGLSTDLDVAPGSVEALNHLPEPPSFARISSVTQSVPRTVTQSVPRTGRPVVGHSPRGAASLESPDFVFLSRDDPSLEFERGPVSITPLSPGSGVRSGRHEWTLDVEADEAPGHNVRTPLETVRGRGATLQIERLHEESEERLKSPLSARTCVGEALSTTSPVPRLSAGSTTELFEEFEPGRGGDEKRSGAALRLPLVSKSTQTSIKGFGPLVQSSYASTPRVKHDSSSFKARALGLDSAVEEARAPAVLLRSAPTRAAAAPVGARGKERTLAVSKGLATKDIVRLAAVRRCTSGAHMARQWACRRAVLRVLFLLAIVCGTALLVVEVASRHSVWHPDTCARAARWTRWVYRGAALDSVRRVAADREGDGSCVSLLRLLECGAPLVDGSRSTPGPQGLWIWGALEAAVGADHANATALLLREGARLANGKFVCRAMEFDRFPAANRPEGVVRMPSARTLNQLVRSGQATCVVATTMSLEAIHALVCATGARASGIYPLLGAWIRQHDTERLRAALALVFGDPWRDTCSPTCDTCARLEPDALEAERLVDVALRLDDPLAVHALRLLFAPAVRSDPLQGPRDWARKSAYPSVWRAPAAINCSDASLLHALAPHQGVASSEKLANSPQKAFRDPPDSTLAGRAAALCALRVRLSLRRNQTCEQLTAEVGHCPYARVQRLRRACARDAFLNSTLS